MEADEAGQVGALELVSTIGFEGIRAIVGIRDQLEYTAPEIQLI